MVDIFNKDKRSDIMRKVRSTGNKSTELKLIDIFREYSIKGWRRNYQAIGHPDFVFLSSKIAVFVDGCFWHGHNCRNLTPSDNSEYWEKKRKRNVEHDLMITKKYEQRGWIVIRIWECELKHKNREQLLDKLKLLIID